MLSLISNAEAIPRDKNRIVSLAPNLTEIVYALGFGDDLVGDTNQCDYPVAAKTVNKIGDYNNPVIEKILEAKANTVLATEGNPRPIVNAIKKLNINVIETNPQTIDELISSIQYLGKRLNAEDRSNQIAKSIQDEVKYLKKHPFKEKTFLLALQSYPIYSASDQTWIGDLFKITGLKNIVADSKIKYPVVSYEYVIQKHPDLIFSGSAEPKMNLLGKRLVVLPKDIFFRPGPRVLDSLKFLESLHID
jgi:iron complex transport system substrate-binding protein